MEVPRDFRRYKTKGVPTVTLDRGRVLAAAGAEEELHALGLDTVAGAMAFRQGELVRSAGPRNTWKVAGPSGVLFVKVINGVPLRHRLLPLGRNISQARLEWDNIGALRRAGFDMPEPLAMGEDGAAFGMPPRSFLVTREVAGRPLDEVLAEGWPDPHGLGRARARAAVIRDVSGLVRRFHACGFFHRDLYLCHFIVAADPRWGRPYLIDLARVGQRFPPRARWLVKDLAALHHSAPASVSRTDRLRFLLSYLCKSRLDPEGRRWLLRILRKQRRISRHRPRYG